MSTEPETTPEGSAGTEGPSSTPTAGDDARLDSTTDKVKLGIIGGLTLALAAAVIGFAVIGGEEDEGGGGGSTAEVSTDLETKPTPQAPGGEPPDELVTTDIVEGEGKEAAAGDEVSVQYVGVTYDDGSEFDASWDRGEPFTFELGAGQVIPGWDEGVAGMREGGRRQLTIPPGLAYGAQGSLPDIGPNETLVFVVDLVEVD